MAKPAATLPVVSDGTPDALTLEVARQVLAGMDPEELGRGVAPLFVLAGEDTGLIHTHKTTQGLLLPAASHAAGGAAADFNGNGLHDLFVLGGGVFPDRMFVNNGDGTFTDMAPQWGLDRMHHAYGVSVADFNNDGNLDMLITSYGPSDSLPQARRHLLLRNDGEPGSNDRNFVNVADEAGLNNFFSNFVDGTGSGWGDINLNGRLDLMICGYRSQHAGNRLYRNDGPDQDGVWRFTDITEQAGMLETRVHGFLPRFIDLTGNRYPDLLLIADTGTSRVYINNGDETFTRRNDLAPRIGIANAMGVDVGDINNNGLLDFYVTNITQFGSGNLMFVQNEEGYFIDRAAELGVLEGYWGWGTIISDFDNDGHLDIAETNGALGQFANSPSLLYMNNGNGVSFTDRAQELGFIHNGQGRGLIRMDIDNDGDLDLVIICNNQPMAVFRNTLIGPDRVTPPDANWLRVVLTTSDRPTLAPNGIGSMVRIISNQGPRIAPIDNASNHCTTSPMEAHFGLGTDTMVDVVRAEWPDGTHTTLMNVAANQVLRISAPAHPLDFDGSGTVDALDVIAFIQAFKAGDLNADLDGNWRLDFFDIARFVQMYRDAM
ncbi:MAG: CRTAC1 family protein [Phycisphaerales bacterium]|nr:CRTAC1 family protein [Planctomycetota bacterium]MCH8509422.1 CRTAC1 family protein [Phycisphaerales bacterium]